MIIVCFLVFSNELIQAQTFKLDECEGNTKRSTSLFKSIIFTNAGININKYDWKNPQLNCHINSTMNYAKKTQINKTVSLVLVSTGGAFILGGVTAIASYQTGVGAAFLVPGILCAGGSIPFFIFTKRSKKKMNYHLDQVSEYYRVNNMF